MLQSWKEKNQCSNTIWHCFTQSHTTGQGSTNALTWSPAVSEFVILANQGKLSLPPMDEERKLPITPRLTNASCSSLTKQVFPEWKEEGIPCFHHPRGKGERHSLLLHSTGSLQEPSVPKISQGTTKRSYNQLLAFQQHIHCWSKDLSSRFSVQCYACWWRYINNITTVIAIINK